ncbi:MAG TPA: hypothetical protein VLA05_02080 [Coriobacteriia bacterium]|nr:hypothetical protein [Coriobacteriia bacterium]
MTRTLYRRDSVFMRFVSAFVALAFALSLTGSGFAAPSVLSSSESTAPAAVDEAPPVSEPVPTAAKSVEGEPDKSVEANPTTTEPGAEPSGEVATPKSLARKSTLDTADAGLVAAAKPIEEALAAPGTDISIVHFEGYNRYSGWTTGNLGKNYEEGDDVAYRLVLKNTGTEDASPLDIIVGLDHYTGGSVDSVMFESTDDWGYSITAAQPSDSDPEGIPSGHTPIVPATQDVGVQGSSPEIVTTISSGTFVIPAGQYATVYFTGYLAMTLKWQPLQGSDGAGGYPGSSGHGYLRMGAGSKTVPLPAVDVPAGSITVLKYNDLNRNNVQDAGEAPLPGWEMHLQNGISASATTGADGTALFDWLPSGTYYISETLKDGWQTSTPQPLEVPLAVGENKVVKIGNYQLTPPVVDLEKTVAPASLAEPGGDFTFTLTITNTGTTPFTITSLTDDNLSAPYPAAVQALIGQTLAVGASVSADYTVAHTDAGSYDNTANILVTNSDGLTDTDTDSATVTVTDTPTVVELEKTVAPSSMPEPGGEFIFTLTITNNGVEPFTITSLTDTNLSEPYPAAVQALIGQTVAVGENVSASYPISHVEAGSYDNTAEVLVTDNDGSTDTDTDSQTVHVTDVLPTITVTKVADPLSLPEPGGQFGYTIVVTNTSVEPVTLNMLTDTLPGGAVISDLAAVGVVLDPGETYTWTPFQTYTEAGLYTDTAYALAYDNEENPAEDSASATVHVTDTPPVVEIVKSVAPSSLAEPGGEFMFTLTINNLGSEPFTITSLTDTNLSAPYPAAVQALIGQTIAVGGSLSASYPISHSDAGSYDNEAVVTVQDNEETEDSDSDSQTVHVTDVLPSITVEKTALPASMPEPGGEFTYTVEVTNTSVESITLGLVTDDRLGTIYDPELEPAIVLASGESHIFTKTAIHTDAGIYENTATASATDNEENEVSASDSASVAVTDVLPTITVDKSAQPAILPAPGGEFTYTIVVTNTSIEDVTLGLVLDNVLGTIYDPASEDPIVLEPQESHTFTKTFTHSEPGVYPNIVTAYAMDNEENSASDSDDASVRVTNPAIEIIKTASETEVLMGSTVTYTYDVTNIGDVDLFDVTVTDDKLGDISAAPFDLAVGESVTLTADAVLIEVTTNVATVVGYDDMQTRVTDTDEVTVDTFLPASPDLTVDKKADKTEASAGDIVKYTLTYENVGGGEAYDIEIVDDFDERYVDIVDAAGGVVEDGKITWMIDGPLYPEDEPQTITYSVRISEDLPADVRVVRNTVVISAPDEEITDNNTDSWEVEIPEPFLPFTGGEWTLIVLLAAAAMAIGVTLRRLGRATS